MWGMAVTPSPNYEFPIATAGSDPTPNRAAWMQIFQMLENKSLALESGTLSNRPTTPVKPLAWWDTARGQLTLHLGGAGNSWHLIGRPLGADPADLVYGSAGVEGLSTSTARADHTHTLPDVAVAHGGTGRTSMTAGRYLRGNGTSAVDLRTGVQVRADSGAVPTSRTVAGKPLTSDVPVAIGDLSDATAVGEAVVTAASQSAARTAIGAGTSSFDGSYSALTGKPTPATLGAVAVASGVVVQDYSTAGQARPTAAIVYWVWVGAGVAPTPTHIQANDFVINN